MNDVKRLPKVISDEQEKLLLSGCRSTRDRAIIRFMLNTGLRVSELCELKLGNLDLNNRYIKIIGKGNKERIVTLNNEVITCLSDYISSKRYSSEYIFSAKGGNKLTRNAVWLMLKKASINSGLDKKVHPHMLRHTFCTRLTENNVSIEKIAELAGHSKLDTTRIYSKVSLNKKHEAVSSLNKKSFFSDLFVRNKETVLKRSLPVSRLKTDTGFIPDIRKEELRRIEENIRLKIHTSIIASEGYGKSSILKYFYESNRLGEKTFFYLDTLESKKDILRLMEDLFNKYFFPDVKDFKELKKELNQLAINEILGKINKNLSEDCVLVIDDVTGLTKRMKSVFYKLSNLFVILTSSEVKHPIILDKFDVVKLDLLSRQNTIVLINAQLNIKDIDYKILLEIYDMIYARSHGFPRAIIEMTDKMKKNNYSVHSMENDCYSNPANQKSIGWLLLFILFIMVAFILKFSTGVFAGAALVYVAIIIIRFIILRRAYKGS